VAAVRADGPLGYWRFEEYTDGLVRNELAGRPGLRVEGDVALVGAAGNHAAAFPAELAARGFVSDGALPELGTSAYTIELWANAASIRTMSLVSLILPPEPKAIGFHHVALLELRALENSLSHPAGAVRYLHRWPPGPAGGTNAFSPRPYRPRSWLHLVGVKDGPTMTLYVNGVATSRVPVTTLAAMLPLSLVAGRLPTQRVWDPRPFVGQLDELALYPRALRESEVRRHHALVVSQALGSQP
jgi:hypothetical protein